MQTGSPKNLLDCLIEKMELKNDAALARRMQLDSPMISRIRSGKMPVGATFLINAHEESGYSIAQLKALAGLPTATQYHA